MKNKIFSYLTFNKDSRSSNIKRNIFELFLFQGFNFFVQLALVPLTLSYLGKFEYGVWLTLSSIMIWLSNFDLGIGNGLRNKLTAAISEEDYEKGKALVSTAYFSFSGLIVLLWIIFFILNFFINWNDVLGVSGEQYNYISTLVAGVFILFTIQFLLKLIYTINSSIQQPGINGFISFILNLVSLIFVYVLVTFYQRSLLILSLGFSLIPCIVFLLFSLYLFRFKFPNIAPSVKAYSRSFFSDIFSLGFQFFIIQAAGIVIYSADNLVITQMFSPEDVTIYNIAAKLFLLTTLVFNTAINPLWSAFTEAYIKKEFKWIKATTNKFLFIWGALSIGTIIMFLLSNYIYSLWIGNSVTIPFMLSGFIAFYCIIMNWNSLFNYFINGTGKIRLQLIITTIIMIINIPLKIVMVKYLGLGVEGVVLANIVCLLVLALQSPMQYYRLVNGKASGIWDK